MSKQTFEEALDTLQTIVGRLEEGSMSLDESMKAFEQAVTLARFCSAQLEGAKQKVRMLSVTEDGSVTDVPFTDADAT